MRSCIEPQDVGHVVFGQVILTFGCIRLALAKGRPWWFGLLGLFHGVGAAILWFVVDDVTPAR